MPSCKRLVLLILGSWPTAILAEDPLPSWNERAAKQSIVAFVQRVTVSGSPDFVPRAERIAVFDNDGTLWCEQPAYPQFVFGMDRARGLAPQHPEWRDREPFKSAVTGDLKGVTASGVKGLIELTAVTHGGMTTDEFDRIVQDWLATARHPRFGRPYTECVYQPMLEVLTYLRANGFKTYIVSGGGLEFMRPWTQRVYAIPPEQVLGSTIVTRFELRDGKPVLMRLAEIELINDKAAKPVAIYEATGRRPLAAFGNSDGDLEMLQWTAAGAGPRFCLFVHHTDADREYAYDRDSPVGRLDKGLIEAAQKRWTIVDIKKDWRRVFPADK
ncbi:MAG: haloacid dehalogenase-like hydrolase [Planctomycetes bacterium]|nr:haloacid dehalogenase-like hydrolase [Planctomycetota bacterium]